MMILLSKNPLQFLTWWTINAPKKLFTVAKRILKTLNNNLSFTLNVRLIFTPIFGDYTWIGRLIGFVFRIVQIISGLVIILNMSILTLATPLLWYLLPIVSFKYLGLNTILLILITYCIWILMTKNNPLKRVKDISDKNYINCFRPLCVEWVAQSKINPKVALEKITKYMEIKNVLSRSEISTEQLLQKIQEVTTIKTDNLEETIYNLAKEQNAKYVEIEHVFLGLIANMDRVEMVLSFLGGNLALLKDTVTWVTEEKNKHYSYYIWQDDYVDLFNGGIGKGMTGRVTPLLDSISRDFTKMVTTGQLKPIIGRAKEIEEIAQILSSEKAEILIIGEPGSGKTSLIQGIAYEIIAGTKFKSLSNKRIVSLETGNLISGTKTPGELADKVSKVMKEVEGSGDIILFIDEIHSLLSGGEKAEIATIYSILEPYISSDKLKFIGATSVANYRKYIEPNGSFSRLFQTVRIEEASKEDTILILKDVADKIEEKQKILISYPALVKTVELCEKLIHERVLPDKAIDILSRTASSVVNTTRIVTTDEIAKEISEITKVPVDNISSDESKKLLNIEEEMKKDVIGQDEAVNQIGAALKRARIGIRNDNKPIASFLFVGTTGVGKTQTAKAVAKRYFGNKDTMIRVDMSEYQQLDSMDKLIGNPDGSTKGLLTEKVRTSPFALILLDEIEKAHPNILLTFLQVLDDGRLTDSNGMVIDFTNTIIIATSNTGTRAIQDAMRNSGTPQQLRDAANTEVRNHFAPEFLNRFTGIIVFNPLTSENIKKIALLLMEDIIKKVETKGIKIKIKDDLLDEIVKRGFDPEWGARPLARLIEDTIETYLAVKILADDLKQGDELELGMEVFKKS